MNQTAQMHKISIALEGMLTDVEIAFTPYYATGLLEMLRKWGLLDFTILGALSSNRVMEYCRANGLILDDHGRQGPYDLVLTCADLIMPHNIRHSPIILVQEGMTDPEGWAYHLVRWMPLLPRWIASTAMMGLSGRYTRFCVASEAYKELFIRKGAPARKLMVTGIPNFDDCAKHLYNEFMYRDYFLVCTSDLRETFIPENRKKFIHRAVELAAGRPILFKLHPNENWPRAKREIERYAPGSKVFTSENTDDMIANCSGFLTHYSSTVFVALALGKEVHCDLNIEDLKALLPVQNRSAAQNIANVCLDVLRNQEDGVASTLTYSSARHPVEWARAYYRARVRAVSE